MRRADARTCGSAARRVLPVKGVRSYSILICIACMILLCGCEAKIRYQVLSFFFDGVPDPERQSETSGNSAGPGADKTAGRPNQPSSSTHGPYAAKMCAACHDPNTNALLLPKDKLCLKCHTLNTGRRQHGPVASGGCLVCHDPHRSAFQYLLVSPAREFCTYCHEPKEIYSREAHRGITTDCTECHNPHGSDNEFFLK
jgi:predicted CXXCH cytochrome family protein